MFVTRFLDYRLRGRLQHLILHVTSRCNCRCRHCFVDFSNATDLPVDLYRKVAQHVGGLLWLDIGGGEPFLRDDLPELIGLFGAEVTMIPTNGFLGDAIVEQVQRIMATCRTQLGVSISIEGPKDINDGLRQEGSWDAAWATLRALRAIDGLSLKVNTVLSRENMDEILPFMDEVYDAKPDFHSVILLRGTPHDAAVELPSLEDLQRLIPEIMTRQERYHYGQRGPTARLLRNYHRMAWRTSFETLRQRTQVVPCLAGRAHAVVWADGSVASCEMLPAVGRLTESDWPQIIGSDAFRAQVESIRAKQCHCTHNCALLDSILMNPACLPRLLVPAKFPAGASP